MIKEHNTNKCEDRKLVSFARSYRELPFGERRSTPQIRIHSESSPLNGHKALLDRNGFTRYSERVCWNSVRLQS